MTSKTSQSSISTDVLFEQLGSPELVVVDVRGAAAYNGWRLEGEIRGGHIRGAVSFPLSWARELPIADLEPLLAAKGIRPDKIIVVYGATGDDGATMARLLRAKGYRQVLTYDAGLAEWAANEALPMARLVNYEKLVHPGWVHELVRGDYPVSYPGRGFVVLDVGSEERRAYRQGHIPGAVHLDTAVIEARPLWNRVSDEELEAALVAHGVSHDTTVVLYGRDTTAAARAAVIFMYAGVEDVRLLDGGFEAWTSAGFEVETGTHNPTAASAFGKEIPAHPEYIVGINEAQTILADNNAELVSVRSWAEYTGRISGYGFIQPKGRIAGAAWGHAGSAPDRMDHLRNMDNTMRSHHEIEANWRDWGITRDKRVAFYCGTGWRASEAFFYAHLMGWQNISVYDGGWYEWSADPANPVESGEPTGRHGTMRSTSTTCWR